MSPRPTRGYDNAFMPTVVHKGIVLRPYQATDAEAFAVAVRESVDTVGLWMPWCHAANSQQEALIWFDTCAKGLTDRSSFEFGVFAEENGSFLGGAGLNYFNVDHNSAISATGSGSPGIDKVLRFARPKPCPPLPSRISALHAS